MKDFALIGAAGYIAPSHMKAIKETGNNLVAALDKNDSVGVIDSFFPGANFFTEFERFDRHIDLLKRKGGKVDYVSIASPNYLHDSHIRFALRSGSHAICEKPVVLNPWNIDGLKEVENDTGLKIYNILQLRLHPSIIELKEKVTRQTKENPGKKFKVDLTYLTSRGNWYFSSWKGVPEKAGGIASNIGIHFFDMLIWIFGGIKDNVVHLYQPDAAAGYLELKHASVSWFLSVNYEYVPDDIKAAGQRTYRSITVDDEEMEFSGGFADLHTKSYKDILSGGGFDLEQARQSIETVHAIRVSEVKGLVGDYHPFAKKVTGR